MRRGRRAEGDEAMLVEIGDGSRLAALLEIVGRGVGVKMHGEQAPADQVGLHRLAQAKRDVGFAHAQVQFVVGQQKLQFDFRVELDEFAQARRQPIGAQRQGGGDAQVAMRLFAGVDQPAAHRVELEHDVLHRFVQHFALLGENEAAGVAMKERRAEVLFERADLPAHRGLAQAQRLAGVGEGTGVGRGLKNAQLVPVHRFLSGTPGHSHGGLRLGNRDAGARDGEFAISRVRLAVFCARLLRRRARGLLRGEPAFGLERRHAAEAGGGDRLAEDIVRDVAGGENAFDARRGRAGARQHVAVRLERELAAHQFARRRVADRDEDSVGGDVFAARRLRVSRSRAPVTSGGSRRPRISSIARFHFTVTLGRAASRSHRIFSARNESRR